VCRCCCAPITGLERFDEEPAYLDSEAHGKAMRDTYAAKRRQVEKQGLAKGSGGLPFRQPIGLVTPGDKRSKKTYKSVRREGCGLRSARRLGNSHSKLLHKPRAGRLQLGGSAFRGAHVGRAKT
jgi:hypothetical protein